MPDLATRRAVHDVLAHGLRGDLSESAVGVELGQMLQSGITSDVGDGATPAEIVHALRDACGQDPVAYARLLELVVMWSSQALTSFRSSRASTRTGQHRRSTSLPHHRAGLPDAVADAQRPRASQRPVASLVTRTVAFWRRYSGNPKKAQVAISEDWVVAYKRYVRTG